MAIRSRYTVSNRTSAARGPVPAKDSIIRPAAAQNGVELRTQEMHVAVDHGFRRTECASRISGNGTCKARSNTPRRRQTSPPHTIFATTGTTDCRTSRRWVTSQASNASCATVPDWTPMPSADGRPLHRRAMPALVDTTGRSRGLLGAGQTGISRRMMA